MKRISIFFAVWFGIALTALPILFAPTPTALSAKAEGETYAVAVNENVWFYGSKNEDDKLFCIPESYYVKIISREEEFTFCEYLKDTTPYKRITGYCLTSALTFVDFVPERPYLFREVTMQYKLDGANFGSGKFATVDVTYVYYGTRYVNEQLYFYVGKNGEYDYVPAEKELSFEHNTDYLPDPAEPTAASAKSSGGLSAVQIVLITLAAVAVIVVAVFVAHGKKSAPSENFEP